MNCAACKHWRESGKDGLQGYGICDARPGPQAVRMSHYTADSNRCRLERFEAKGDALAAQKAGLL